MRVRLAKLKFKMQKPPFEFFEQPLVVGKPADEKCELLIINQEQCSRMSEDTDRVGGKTLLEVILDRVHGRLNRGLKEPRNFCAVCENISAPIHSWGECESTQSTLAAHG